MKKSLCTSVSKLAVAGSLLLPAMAVADSIHFFQPDISGGAVGYLAVSNPGDSAVTVTIAGVDDTGANAPGGDVTLTLGSGQSKYLSSADIEVGRSDTNGAFGNGSGFWHLDITATSEINVQNFLYTLDGALNELTTPLTAEENGDYKVRFFTEPGASVFDTKLRLRSLSATDGTITVTATESSGTALAGSAIIDLPAGTAVEVTNAMLGAGSPPVSGSLPTGDGFWIINLDPDVSIAAIAIAQGSTGQIADIGSGVTIAGTISNESNSPCDNFLDVQPDSNNSEYPDPELTVSCSSDTLTVQTNNIPNFEFVQTTPSELEAQDFNFEIPLNPVVDPTPDDVPTVGQIGVTVGGLMIYAPNEAPSDGFRDPILDELQDYCSGHTGGGIYHHHSRPACIIENAGEQTGLVLGYAFDGYPIMHPYECRDESCTEVYNVRSSYQFIGGSDNAYEQNEYVEGLGDLDECNGMTRPDGTYAYYMTEGFPYTLRCYHGVANEDNFVNSGGGGGGGGQGGGGGS